MFGKPLFFPGIEIPFCVGAQEIFIVELLVKIFILILYPIHRCVQLCQKIRPVFLNGKIEIGRAYLTYGNCRLRIPVDIHCNKGIQLLAQQQQRFLFGI